MPTAQQVWAELREIPVNESDELDQDFTPTGFKFTFEKGTDKEDVWHWIEDTFNVCVTTELLYPKQPKARGSENKRPE